MGKQQVARLKSFLASRIESAGDDFMDDLSYTLAEHRTHYPWRKAITASTAQELHDALESDSAKFSKSKAALRLGFVFTGQGAHWYAMGRELLHQYPVFSQSLERAEKYLKEMGAEWSLIGKKPLCLGINSSSLTQTCR